MSLKHQKYDKYFVFYLFIFFWLGFPVLSFGEKISWKSAARPASSGGSSHFHFLESENRNTIILYYVKCLIFNHYILYCLLFSLLLLRWLRSLLTFWRRSSRFSSCFWWYSFHFTIIRYRCRS